jgi:hypothetical protein
MGKGQPRKKSRPVPVASASVEPIRASRLDLTSADEVSQALARLPLREPSSLSFLTLADGNGW